MAFPTLSKRGFVMPTQRASYDSAGSGRRATKWTASGGSANAVLNGSLPTLRNRARAARRNDPWAKSALAKLTANLVGTGIKPISKATDPDLRKAVHELWLDWTDESDADGVTDFYGQQALAAHSFLESGEVFGRLRPRLPEDGLSVPLQVQILEADHVPTWYNVNQGSTVIRAGIEFDAIGRRAAYWMYRSHPGDLYATQNTAQLVRVPASEVIHVYQQTRPGQLRGEPLLTQVLLRLYELDQYDDAELVRKKTAALFAGFIKRAPGDSTEYDPLTGKLIEEDGDDVPMVSLEPGTMQELDYGADVVFSEPSDVGQMYPEFMRQQLLAVAAGSGVPYEVLTGDMSKVNDRTLRAILNEFRRWIQQLQGSTLIFQFCRPIWNRWFDLAVLSSALSAPGYSQRPKQHNRVKWMPQGWQYLHPLQDVQAKRLAVRAGFSTRSMVVAEQGYDVEEIDDENAADNQRADDLELVYDSDARRVNLAGLAQPDSGDGDPSNSQS